MTRTTTIHGHKVRTTSIRRYVVVLGRATDVVDERFATPLKAFARVEARSDSWAKIRERASKMGAGFGGFTVIWDTETGEHFDWAGRPLG